MSLLYSTTTLINSVNTASHITHSNTNASINQYYFIAAWQNAGPQFAQIKIQYSTIKYNTMKGSQTKFTIG